MINNNSYQNDNKTPTYFRESPISNNLMQNEQHKNSVNNDKSINFESITSQQFQLDANNSLYKYNNTNNQFVKRKSLDKSKYTNIKLTPLDINSSQVSLQKSTKRAGSLQYLENHHSGRPPLNLNLHPNPNPNPRMNRRLTDFHNDMEEFDDSKEVPSQNHQAHIGDKTNDGLLANVPRLNATGSSSNIYYSPKMLVSPTNQKNTFHWERTPLILRQYSRLKKDKDTSIGAKSFFKSIDKADNKSYISIKAGIPLINSLKVDNIIQNVRSYLTYHYCY